MDFACLQIALGLVQFGFVVTYLSEPLVRGYTTGAAIHVIVSQLKYTFGINPQRYAGPISLVYVRRNQAHRSQIACGFDSLQNSKVLSAYRTLGSSATYGLFFPSSLSPDRFGDLLPRSTDKHRHPRRQYRHHSLSHYSQGNQCPLE